MFKDFQVSADTLSAVAAALLSLLFTYVPGLSDWYGKLRADQKRLVMLAALVIVSVGVFALSCGGYADWVACTQAGAIGLIEIFITAAIANQATHRLTPTS